MNGYQGKILRLDLTNQRTSVIKTADYAQWGGGHGMGSAIFWDLCKDKTIGGLDPANVITMMTSPMSGTMALQPSPDGATTPASTLVAWARTSALCTLSMARWSGRS